jgi:universal stress protein A
MRRSMNNVTDLPRLPVGSILCPVDYSEQSRQALRWASTIAQRRDEELTVLSVVEPLLAQAAGIRDGVDLARVDAASALREFVEATFPDRSRRASHIRMKLAVGNASDVILRSSRTLNAGLIVMGTHGRGGLGKLILGSTTEDVLRRTECPILAVPEGAAPDVDHPDIQLNTILLATDFRESAMAATQWATDLASDLSIPLVLAHVVEPVAMPPRWQALAAEFESDRISTAQRMLEKLSVTARHTHNRCVVSVGPPADAIASLAGEHRAGLVVMGLADPVDSEPRKPGSIAYRLLRIARVAVVVVPALRHTRTLTDSIAGVQRPSIDAAV